MTEHIVKASDRIWDIAVRWRTWLVNVSLALMLILPDLLNSPEVLAIIPESWTKYVIAAGFLLNILMRPRKAARARDFEAK